MINPSNTEKFGDTVAELEEDKRDPKGPRVGDNLEQNGRTTTAPVPVI